MIVGKLDLGSYNPFKQPDRALHTGVVTIPGGYAVAYSDHSDPDAWHVRIWINAPNAVGGFTAGSQGAAEFLSHQLEELARNPDQQPTFIQLFAGTGTVAHSPAFSEPQDGYYFLPRVAIDYTHALQGYTEADIDLQYVSPGPPRSVGMSMAGGALFTGFGGSITNWCAYPLNAAVPLVDASRTGAEGAVQINIGPFLNPSPFVPSSTIADWWKGGCQVYDVMAGIGSRAVPAAPAAFNTNWTEVFGKDHRFAGDIVISNGLHLWTLALGASPGITGYLWNTALGTAGWQQFGTLNYLDDGANGGTLRQVAVQRVSLEEVRVDCWLSTTSGAWAKLTIRLQRGGYVTRLEFTPMAESNTQSNFLYLGYPTNPKIVYNSTTMTDNLVAGASLAATTDYGYAAAIIANSAYPFIAGPLWQSAPSANQPVINANTNIGFGETTGPAQNASRQYGVFAVPFGVSAQYSPANLQQEMEGATLAGGFVSVADAAASAGNTAKLPNTTVVGATATQASYSPSAAAAGTYDVWARVKVTSAASGTTQLRLGMYEGGSWGGGYFTDYAPSAFTTSFAWYRCVMSGSFPTGHTWALRAEGVTNTAATDFFVDEMVAVPKTLTSNRRGPQESWQQFEYDRSTRIRIQ